MSPRTDSKPAWRLAQVSPMAVVAVVAVVASAWCGLPAWAQSPAPARAAPPATSAQACPPLLQHTFPRLQDEKPQPLCQYAGKVLLVVNTASYCGFTSQYEGLEALYARYAARGLVVMGFPSNDFNQETGSAQQIADLCFNTYGVKFPMFAKTSVAGREANPFFKALAREADQVPRWNFYKYLVDRRGKVVESWSSMTGPTDRKITAAVERALAQP